MRKSKLQFWIKCPECGNRFGVQPQLVLKYLDRLGTEMKEIIRKLKDRKQKGSQ